MAVDIPAHRLYHKANWDQFTQILRDSHINIPSEMTECKLDKMVNKLNHILDKALDKSNNGFSFVNIYWASFSTGLSSVLAVLVAGLLIAGCCYFRGHQQRQSRARHTELLHTIAFSTRHCYIKMCSVRLLD